MLKMFKKHLEQHELERLVRHAQSSQEDAKLLRAYLTNKLIEQMDIASLDTRHPHLEAVICGRKFAAKALEEIITFLLDTDPKTYSKEREVVDRRMFR